ncbi:MAG: H/ACA RNA-protein complex component Nop10p [Candidatus Aramenus sulfurataquae]|jgi:H/ACA ribonucleoprotein complex subunit 3|uniref:Ribosome biogenesis protein Nop10 n=2 Tax=Candidatus Aramenus sulfurataquae TaxID=1326980 RepID=W7KWT9_9CREN|nr:MAG: H/ACA RNA-protein complex component Nop10p [Candidatus Aramenus sulfurataquae]MBW9140432.1 RNA-protein complex protein Nop10 [Candidatus Aramenus sp.]MCL7343986.1 RNA-protein complex protein Nop10 [Candidatus Aramenus sulfurataquae]
MKWKLRKCVFDGTYTFEEKCPKCGRPTVVPHPPRFSPEDKYVKYRLEVKKGRKFNC